jgi:uncharacterized membrane protein YgdD (TMEM256/DUF423 family)
MNQKTILTLGAVAGALGVAIGAFGAHGLKEILAQTQRADTFELAVRYQFYHTFAILLSGVLMEFFESKKLGIAAILFAVGIFIFSGSLYILSLTGITVLGAITPFGGLSLIAGWIFLALSFSKKK